MKEITKEMTKTLLFVGGLINLILAFIGLLLPIVPATPFALLSAFCFSKSSPGFYRWLIGLPMLGPAIVEWTQYQVIRPRAKVLSTLLILGSMGLICWNSVLSTLVKALLCGLLGLVILFILSRRSHLP